MREGENVFRFARFFTTTVTIKVVLTYKPWFLIQVNYWTGIVIMGNVPIWTKIKRKKNFISVIL